MRAGILSNSRNFFTEDFYARRFTKKENSCNKALRGAYSRLRGEKNVADFFFNPSSGENYHSQWVKYLQTEEFVSEQTRQMSKAVGKYVHDFQATMDLAARDQSRAMEDLAFTISDSFSRGLGSLEGQVASGLAQVSAELSGVANQVGELGRQMEDFTSLVDWRMSMMIEQQRLANVIAGNIALLLRIPDSQKDRQHLIEQGLKFFQNGRLDSDLYVDALERLHKALEYDDTDYFVLHRIGMIYLYGGKCIDVAKAQEYFQRAAKYAVVESNPDAVRLVSVLAQNSPNQLNTPAKVQDLAAHSYLQAGIACYVQGNFTEAAQLAGKAYRLHPSLLEAGFTQAKALCAGGHAAEAAPIVTGIVGQSREYALKVVADLDLAPNPEVKEAMAKMRDAAVAVAKGKLDQLKSQAEGNQQCLAVIAQMEQDLAKNTYLGALACVDDINKRRSWIYKKVEAKALEPVGKYLLSSHNERVAAVCVSPDMRIVGVGFAESTGDTFRTVKIYDLLTGKLVSEKDFGEKAKISGLGFPHGRNLVAVGTDAEVQIWDAELSRKITSYPPRFIKEACFSPNGRWLAMYGGGYLHIWDADNNKQAIKPWFANRIQDGTLRFSPDSKKFAFGGGNVILALNDMEKLLNDFSDNKGTVFKYATFETTKVKAVNFSKSGRYIVGAGDGDVKVWEVPTGRDVSSSHRPGRCEYATFLKDDGELAVVSNSSDIFVMDAETMTPLASCKGSLIKAVYPAHHSDYLVAHSSEKSAETMIIYRIERVLVEKAVELPLQEFIDFYRAREQARAAFEQSKGTARGTLTMVKARQAEAQEEKKKAETRARLEQERKLRLEREAKDYFQAAVRKEAEQDKKWLFKNYGEALALYQKAYDMGVTEAKSKIEKLRQKM